MYCGYPVLDANLRAGAPSFLANGNFKLSSLKERLFNPEEPQVTLCFRYQQQLQYHFS